jgi:NADH-quinone oxidoreductase subunit L
VNMRRFGGLAKFLPVTFVTFGFGYLAIIGIPPFSGFFTKDGIIETAWYKGGTAGPILGWCAIIGAGITAFYMTRLMLMTWFGKPRWQQADETHEHASHPHESPQVMLWPMIILAVGSIGAGAFLIIGKRLAVFLEPVTGAFTDNRGLWTVPGGIALGLAVVGVAIAWLMYGRVPVPATAPRGRPWTWVARRDLYGDAINESLLMRPGQWLTRLSVFFDNRGVDGLVNSIAAVNGGSSGRLRKVQSGFVRSYALSMFLGVVLLVAALLVVRI